MNKIQLLRRLWAIVLCLFVLLAASACGSNGEPVPTEGRTSSITTATPSKQEPEKENFMELSRLEDLMQPIFGGTEIKNETVMFLDRGETKSLLFPITSVRSVTSYDGKTVYKEGKDYVVEEGKLKVTASSAIPCITSEKFYNSPGSIINVMHQGEEVPLYWGEGRAMTDWQVNVSYTHTETWSGYKQPCERDAYAAFLAKLEAGEDVTVFFYGDSILYGANASWMMGYAPKQLPCTVLFTRALADLYKYRVHYVEGNTSAPGGSMNTCAVPSDYVGGKRGTITYVNAAIGGWTSQNGVDYMDPFVTEKLERYGCDLFVLGFGMNDGGISPMETVYNLKIMVDTALEVVPNTSVLLLSTMVPNPDGIGWYGNQYLQEAEIQNLADEYTGQGVACAVCPMTSVSLSVLEHKAFRDYSGNNINHPNDFFVRVYAQALLQTVVGYENLK